MPDRLREPILPSNPQSCALQRNDGFLAGKPEPSPTR
ncbi:hypothetical protein BJ980_001529 [Nocardioides daedukensis]|uniref:Uncharacterized protein n=1 Tax=Nocardioides daedukensis TaxID=634462 RepID=A0A7Y9RZZ3_9ACTN|nr:hypothetical protein [Nocardioides daedukensis]